MRSNNELPELKNFVIPGGAYGRFLTSHLARCTCEEELERFITELNEIENVPQIIDCLYQPTFRLLIHIGKKTSDGL